MPKTRYCCFAVPLYNVGIYVILAQFLVIGLTAGVLALAAPSVLAIVVPSYATAIMGVLCILVGLAQLVGFFGVYKEKAVFFRNYVQVNMGLVAVAILYTLCITIVSATRHSVAVDDCLASFVADNSTSTATNGARDLCNIWTWAQLGVCFLLWGLLGASEIYFCIMERVWSSEQRSDHLKYRSIISAARESIALRPSQDWDSSSRTGSMDGEGSRAVPHHGRTNSQPAVGSRLRNEVDWDDPSAARTGAAAAAAAAASGSGSGSGSGPGSAVGAAEEHNALGHHKDDSRVRFEDHDRISPASPATGSPAGKGSGFYYDDYNDRPAALRKDSSPSGRER